MRERKGAEKLSDGFGGEVDGRNFLPDYASNGFAPEGDKHDLTGLERSI